MEMLIRPVLGLIQGCIIYFLIYHTGLSYASIFAAATILTFPLFALQVKLPDRNTLAFALKILVIMALIYGYTAYSLITEIMQDPSFLIAVLTIQCSFSAFIMFVFYCVAVEEKKFSFPYATLFSEAWQVLLKLSLGKLLVMLTWGLFLLAAVLFELLNITLIRLIVNSKPFFYIMLPCFFGIAMTILYQYEDLLTKLRNILLAFCRFLYPLFVVISLSFLIVIPFANKNFDDFWSISILLSTLNIILFNGVFQAGPDQPPYSRWFCSLIYVSLIITFAYSCYVLKYPWVEMQTYGIKPSTFLLQIYLIILALYNFCYSLAIFFSKRPWLSMVKISNTVIALVIAVVYLLMTLPWFNIGKIAARDQQARLLNHQLITNTNNPYRYPGFLARSNLQNANLQGQDLQYVDFSNANLEGSNLSHANLSHARLHGANLHKANLSGANLEGAQLNEANLSEATLEGANLSFAWLSQTNLNHTDLSHTDLSKQNSLKQETLDHACGNDVQLPTKLTIKPCK